MTQEPSELHTTAKFAPVRAITTIAREFDRVARDQDMSIVQYRLMLYLKDGPRRAGEVAVRNLVTNATISGHIAALKKKQWVQVAADENDRRITKLVLTDDGRTAMLNYEEKLLECLTSLFGNEESPGMIEVLGKVYWSLSATRESRYNEFEYPEYKFVTPEIR